MPAPATAIPKIAPIAVKRNLFMSYSTVIEKTNLANQGWLLSFEQGTCPWKYGCGVRCALLTLLSQHPRAPYCPRRRAHQTPLRNAHSSTWRSTTRCHGRRCGSRNVRNSGRACRSRIRNCRTCSACPGPSRFRTIPRSRCRKRHSVPWCLRTRNVSASAMPACIERCAHKLPEQPMSPARKTQSTVIELPHGVRITHPDRVIDASTGITKGELMRYHVAAAKRLLPQLRGRPVALVRGPEGVDGVLFFQKHARDLRIPGLKRLDPKLDPGRDALLEIASEQALLGAVQMNVLEFHTWNAR